MKTVIYRSTKVLECPCDSDIIVCISSTLVADGAPFINATLSSITTSFNSCSQETVYNYFIEYEESQLLDPAHIITNSEITGVVCRDCLVTWIEANIEAAAGCSSCPDTVACVRPFIYPECFGALGDGVRDDSGSINDAIDAAVAVGQGVIVLSSGKNYLVNSTVTVPITARNLTIIGYGATITGVLDAPIIKISDLTTQNNRAENIHIKGLTILGTRGSNDSLTSQVGVEIDAVIQCSLEDMLIENIVGTAIIGTKSSQTGSRYWNVVKFDHVSIRFIGGQGLNVCATGGPSADDLTIVSCLINNVGMLTPALTSDAGVAITVGGALSVSFLEVSAVTNYIRGMAVRHASGILSGLHFEENCGNQANSCDLLLDTDCFGLNVIGSSHTSTSLSGAKTAILCTSPSNRIDGVQWSGSAIHTYDVIVDVSSATKSQVGTIAFNGTPTFGPNIAVVSTGGFGKTTSLSYDEYFQTGRRRERFQTKYATSNPPQIALDSKWGSTATVTAVNAYDSHGDFTVNSLGTGQAINASITITFADGAWPVAPTAIVLWRNGSAFPQIFWNISTTTLTIFKFTLPVAGQSDTFSYSLVGF